MIRRFKHSAGRRYETRLSAQRKVSRGTTKFLDTIPVRTVRPSIARWLLLCRVSADGNAAGVFGWPMRITNPLTLPQVSQVPQEAKEAKEAETSKRKYHKPNHKVTQVAQVSACVACVLTLRQAVEISSSGKLNRRSLFKYSQALKALEQQTGEPITDKEVPNVFAAWWLAAVDKLPDGSLYDLYFAKFKYIFRRTSSPLHIAPLDDALEYARMHPAPATLGSFGTLSQVCKRLSELTAPEPFYLSSRQVGKIIGSKDAYEAMGAIEHLIDLGYVACTAKGVGRKATQYRYLK